MYGGREGGGEAGKEVEREEERDGGRREEGTKGERKRGQ